MLAIMMLRLISKQQHSTVNQLCRITLVACGVRKNDVKKIDE
jgi:hypothetical protein